VPQATTVVYVGSTPYYYYGGTYYVATDKPAEQPQDAPTTEDGTITSTVTTEEGETELPPVAVDEEQNYEVVGAPVGATVPYLPDDAKEKMVDGSKFFVHETTWYRPFSSDGETIYMVVDDPTAAS
jgi:hypothetical protein